MTMAQSEIAAHTGDLAALCRRLHVRRLDLFGSAIRTHDPRDLDFLVQFDVLAPAAYADAWFALREALEAMFGKPVDLISAEAIENPYFAESISNSRMTVFAV